MKVAIITMHCPLNYGAVLQTYALQTYIESLGHDVQIIDYRPNYLVYDQSYTYIPKSYQNRNIFVKALYIALKSHSKFLRKSIFKNFYKSFLHLTSYRYRLYSELVENTPVADIYICGSDQIWNYSSGAFKDPAYFLAFAPKGSQRFSYAASGNIPSPLPVDMREVSIPLINELDAVSVRENSAKRVLEQYVDKSIDIVADPVFLWEKSFWLKFSVNSHLHKDYILVYPVGEATQLCIEAERLSKRTGLPVYMISASQRRINGIKSIMPSPNEFVGLFSKAAYVLTNSFHGTAFSIIFEKEFWTVATSIANNRIMSLLSVSGLTDRYITPENHIDNLTPINHSQVKENLKAYKDASKSFLQKNLE